MYTACVHVICILHGRRPGQMEYCCNGTLTPMDDVGRRDSLDTLRFLLVLRVKPILYVCVFVSPTEVLVVFGIVLELNPMLMATTIYEIKYETSKTKHGILIQLLRKL